MRPSVGMSRFGQCVSWSGRLCLSVCLCERCLCVSVRVFVGSFKHDRLIRIVEHPPLIQNRVAAAAAAASPRGSVGQDDGLGLSRCLPTAPTGRLKQWPGRARAAWSAGCSLLLLAEIELIIGHLRRCVDVWLARGERRRRKWAGRSTVAGLLALAQHRPRRYTFDSSPLIVLQRF